MKKFFSLAIAAIMMFMLAVPAFAEGETPETTINDSLITWWNFEGSTEADALKDKAANGASTDDLTKNGSATTIENGVAYVPSAPGNNFEMTAASADLVGVSSMTIYMKAKYSGANTDFADLFCYNGLYRIYKLKDSTSSEGAVLEASAFATKNNTALGTVRIRPKSDGAVGIQQNEWFYVALTMEIGSDNTGTAILYVSKDGINYSKSETTMSFTAEILADLQTRQADATALVNLGKLVSATSETPDRGISYWYDDVRIYNTVLTQTEIATIIPNSLELRAESDLPSTDTGDSGEDTTAPVEDTTAPDEAATTAPTNEDTTAPENETQAPTNTDSDTATTENNGNTSDEGGCKSVIGGSAITAILLCGACVFVKKKHCV